MPTGYEEAPVKVKDLVGKVMFDHHQALAAQGVTVSVLWAFKFDKNGESEPAMMVRGHVALAKTSITSLSDRARGIPDAKLVIDRTFGWERLADSRRIALIDHELTHLELVVDKDNAVKIDDTGRPKLKIRHHDWELTGFAEVCERHGEAAIEVREMVRWQEKWGQACLFPLAGTTETYIKIFDAKEVKSDGEIPEQR